MGQTFFKKNSLLSAAHPWPSRQLSVDNHVILTFIFTLTFCFNMTSPFHSSSILSIFSIPNATHQAGLGQKMMA